MNDFMRATYEVARKEVLQHLRTKRLLIIGPIFILVMVLVTIVFPTSILKPRDIAAASAAAGVSAQNIAILFFLTPLLFLSGYFYLELVPILLTADAVCSEWASKTIFLLLSKPVSRVQFVLGKFFGSIVTVAGFLVGLMLLDYLLLQIFLPGHSGGEDWLRFFGALGILVLGATAYTSIALFFSTLTRSAVMANLLAITSWIMVFPLLAKVDYFIAVSKYGISAVSNNDPASIGIGWSRYLSPGDSMTAAGKLLLPKLDSDTSGVLSLFGVVGPDAFPAIVALLVQTGIFLGLSIWVVQRRNFE